MPGWSWNCTPGRWGTLPSADPSPDFSSCAHTATPLLRSHDLRRGANSVQLTFTEFLGQRPTVLLTVHPLLEGGVGGSSRHWAVTARAGVVPLEGFNAQVWKSEHPGSSSSQGGHG